MTTSRTQVAIVGGGPAGLMLSHLLHLAGIETVVFDNRTVETIENTHRAGILEHDSVRLLVESGVSDRVLTDGHEHGGIDLRFGGQSHRIDFQGLVGASCWLYPQTDVFIDLHRARSRDGGDLRYGVSETEVREVETSPVVHYLDAEGQPRGHRRRGRRRGRVAQHVPGAGLGRRGGEPAVRARVPVRLVRGPGRGAAERAGADLHPLGRWVRAGQPTHRAHPADVLPVRPDGGRDDLVRRPDLGAAPDPTGRRRRVQAHGGAGHRPHRPRLPQLRPDPDAPRAAAAGRRRRAHRPADRRQGPQPRARRRPRAGGGARAGAARPVTTTHSTPTRAAPSSGSGGHSTSPTG